MANIVLRETISPQFLPLSLLRAIWKHKLLIGVATVLGISATATVAYRLERVYQAEALILVESQKIPEAFVAATVQTSLESRLDSLKEQVLSNDRLWSLVTSLNLYPTLRLRATKEEVLQSMRTHDLEIKLERNWSARGPGAFRVVFRAPTPTVSAEVTNRISMFFINENLRQRTTEAEGTSHFLTAQLAAASENLQQQEGRLMEFKLTHNGELPEQEAALLASMNQSRTELLGTQDALSRAQQNKLVLDNSLAYALEARRARQRAAQQQAAQRAAQPTEVTTPGPSAPTPLERAEADLQALRARYYDHHPEVQRMVTEVERLKRQMPQQRQAEPEVARSGSQSSTTDSTATPANPVEAEAIRAEENRIQDLRSQIAVTERDIELLGSRRNSLLADIADLRARVGKIPVREQQLSGIMRDYQTSRTNYDQLLTKKMSADVATEMERWQKSAKLVLLDAATVPEKPVRPRTTMLLAAGTLGSLLLSLMGAILLEWRKNRFLGEWELPSGTPVLARIPVMKLDQREPKSGTSILCLE